MKQIEQTETKQETHIRELIDYLCNAPPIKLKKVGESPDGKTHEWVYD